MQFINSINHYRALAIIFVVASHAFDVSLVHTNTFFEKVIKNLVSGGTINFVFISGFLFYTIFYQRFEFKTFLKSKVKRILLPYLFLSIVPIILYLLLKPDYWNATFLNYTLANDSIAHYLISIIKYLISGGHMVAYWYIPFAMLLFLLSPLHIKFIKLKLNYQVIIIVVLLTIAMFIHRPYEKIRAYQAIHSLVYFTPIYLLGMLCAKYKDHIYKWLNNRDLYLLLLVLGLAIYQAYLGYTGNYHADFNEINGTIDLMLFQKLAMCLFFMVWLHRFEDYKHPFIDTLAKISFPIFFLHGYILNFLFVIHDSFIHYIKFPWLAYVFFTVLIVVSSVVLAKIIVKVFPKYSLMLIGYGTKK
ncbi:acyltransferase [Tamlana sp. 2_MG-2023]|uniref:acyltransferase family protein n=1 Tax=unclassified Tamlana TaxID=2614803 RepID=UPI0026E45078|nr:MULTISPECIES: acyltransferase [unclassified Tamlana]MDO6758920.1 acyltransferase [Tamlana sp. 2_MG-2023]MDO6789619.1 acyltransferase [Tamlana sp. 1_MG-2023]